MAHYGYGCGGVAIPTTLILKRFTRPVNENPLTASARNPRFQCRAPQSTLTRAGIEGTGIEGIGLFLRDVPVWVAC